MGERYLAQLNARQSIRRGVYKNLYKQRVNYGGRKYVVEVKKYSGFFDWFIHLFDSRVSNTFTDKEKSKLKLQVMHKPVENFTENDKKRLKQKKARVYSKLKRLFKGYKVGGSKVSSKMVEETYWPETFEITFNSNKHHIYLTALQPYFKEWKNSSDIDEDFVSWMEKKFKKLDTVLDVVQGVDSAKNITETAAIIPILERPSKYSTPMLKDDWFLQMP